MHTWVELNKKLRETSSIDEVKRMFNTEMNGLKRPRWLKRIWARFRKLRTIKERKEMKL